ncbi:VIT family-domain-containing protein [Talaromyces proteolyticus]|uniref:VIT family-domain-containing protein n=1 Tax=Talaromyces proteolyticus TaxID=1131652 RepID=A0AAD4KPF1_9EURO|nr:VIT family-domain-containing protein [Talaromyces proteolyticus]KAH8697447.1 VIT family-domain-containing protein [Talaromyces proteolyticus]
MALLFLKQKLFPSSVNNNQRGARSEPLKKNSYSSDLSKFYLNSPCYNNNGVLIHRPLLPDPENFDGSTVDGYSDRDVEAQMAGSYSTFAASPPGSPDTDDVESNSSSSRSRVDPRLISDAILGLSDGLTVPFALSAGLSAIGDTRVVVLGGLAELTAGAISMGLGGYVGAKSEAESYHATVREVEELMSRPEETSIIIQSTFAAYKLPSHAIDEIVINLQADPDHLRDFLLNFHHHETEPGCNQAYMSALTLALGYFIGGFIPLIPYFIVSQVLIAFYYSIAVMAVTLFVFGYAKTCVVRGWGGSANINAGIMGGLQMCVVGGLAAGAAIALVKLINRDDQTLGAKTKTE